MLQVRTQAQICKVVVRKRDLNNRDGTKGQSLGSEGVNLVPKDQVNIEYKREYNTYLVPKDQEVEMGN